MENTRQKNEQQIIPIFYACDDAFAKFTAVSIKSLIENANKEKLYKIYILVDNVIEETANAFIELENDFCQIEFVCLKDQLKKINVELPLRDYYSKTTYYRLFIAEMYPQYEKAIYIDSDTVVLGDVSEFFNFNLRDNLVGACHDQAILQTDVFANYVEKVLGVDRSEYFNAGILLLNLSAFRKEKVLEQFIKLLSVYTFVVAQDQDYLNVICKGRVLWLNQAWNAEVYGELPVKESEIKIIHYIMVSKPWHYHDCRLKEYFWEYAKKTQFYTSIIAQLNEYTDSQRERDEISCKNLAMLAEEESKREDNYLKIISKRNPERLKVLEKIRQFELDKKFDFDVEDDPESLPLLPNKVDYLGEKLSTRLLTKIANKKAVQYYEKLIKNGTFVIKDINGLENFRKVNCGAVITCNHFSAFDNYVVYRAIRGELKKGQFLYKVIREGNYTNFKGIYGFFFRHCNTLPLSSNISTMKKFMKSVSVLLSRGEKILVYPEQAMWWNYKKPRPLKSGAFKLAVKNGVPIIPAFITLEDTDKLDADGFNIKAHTLWFLPPIYPKKDLTEKQNVEYMKEQNFNIWKETYERVYNTRLIYESR